MRSEAQRAQAELADEIDTLAARLIREQGIPLYDALERAKRMIQQERQHPKRFAASERQP